MFRQNLTTGDLAVWFMDGLALSESWNLMSSRVSDLVWRVVGVK
jgi:hypothetical protein